MEVSRYLGRDLAFRILRAALKGLALGALFFFFSVVLRRLAGEFGGYWYVIDTFAAVYIFFVVAIEFFSKTIFQHVLSVGRELFVILYSLHALGGGKITTNVGVMQISVDLSIILVMLISISLLGLTKNALQAINFLNEKAENVRVSDGA